MKRKLLYTILCLISTPIIYSHAQSLKVFSGVYEDGEAEPGKATYTYYEDSKTREYIKQGLFKYTLVSKSDAGNYVKTIIGNYKHNKKDGLWTYTVNEVDYHTTDGYFTGTTRLTSNYLNGLPNGLWSYSRTYKGRDKRITLTGFVWTPYKTFPTESVTATFKKGVINGLVNFTNSPPYSEYNNISGQFDLNGYMNNQWVFTSPEKIKTVTFKNGIVTEFIVRSKSSGEVLSKEIDNNEMLKLKTDFLAGKVSSEQLKLLKIKVDTLVAVKNDQYNFEMSFNRSEFNYRYIGGDDSYYYQKAVYGSNDQQTNQDGWVDSRRDGTFFMFTKAKIFQLSEIPDYKQLSNIQTNDISDYSEVVEKYKIFIDSYREHLNKDDLSKVEAELGRAKENYKKAAILFELGKADEWLKYNDYKNAVESYNKFLVKWNGLLTRDELSNVNLKLKSAEDKLQQTDLNVAKEKERSNNIEKFNSNKYLIDKHSNEISNAYGYVANVYNAGDAKIKKNIFWAYINIYNDFAKKIQNSLDLDEKVKLTDQIIKVQNKVLELSKVEDTKDIEKAIKKAKTIEDQIAVLN